MLRHLHVRNLAIIDELTLDMAAGFSALTGETGAGKSILIDALGLIVGLRADPLLVRSGAEKAEISAEFSLSGLSGTQAWLAARELVDADHPEQCLLRRVVYAEGGRTRAFINGQAVNAGQLRELGEQLIEVFGQSESQTLTRAAVQRELLDRYGAYDAALDAVVSAAQEYATLAQQIAELSVAGPQDPARLDYLRFQMQELQALNLGADELDKVEAEQRKLANAGRLMKDGGTAQELLYGGENSLYDQLASASSLIGALVPLHAGFAESLALTESSQAQLREAANALKHQLDRLDLDPEHLAAVEKRLSAIHELARRHRVPAAQLPARLSILTEELQLAESASGRVAELERQQSQSIERFRTAAERLSAERRKAAKTLASAVTVLVRGLGMPNAEFRIAIEPAANELPHRHGADNIRFDFSANPGQPPRALAKIASGGELSRLSLALQVAALARGGAPCMIFDEVDAGIGGGVAEIVGLTLRKLGETRQVLCVTHLAQVAAQAHAQFGIRKKIRDGETYTRVATLNGKTRVEELARMQGGLEISGAALTHARELLKRAARV